MKIVFDGQPLLGQKTGIAYYEDGLIRGLLEQYEENEYALDIFTFQHANEKRASVSHYSPNLKIQECSWFSGTLFRMLSLIFPVPYRFFFHEEREITHFCNYVIPFGVKGKKVVTIHDLAFREFPETIRRRTMIMLKRNLKRSIKRADAIVTDSEFTKQEIIKYYGVSPEEIYVVPCGVDTEKFYPEEDTNVISKIRGKYGIEGEYFLYLGTLEPRKNIEGLLQAYQKLLEKTGSSKREVPALVIAGGKGWRYDSIFEKVKELALENQVVFAGYIAEEDKTPLLSGALAFCFPSFYEGFGLPPIEAMACGTPVITSNTSSLVEVTGEAAVQVNPYDTEELASAMENMWRDEKVRQEFREKGFAQVKKYSWKNAVQLLYEVYRILGERK